ILITVFIWNRFRATMRAQVVYLAEACRASAEGVPQVRVPVVGNDEFSMLSANLNVMLSTRDPGFSPSADVATLQNQIEKLLQEVSAVGEGDLSVQAEVTPDTLGVLADSFNYMIEELAKVVGRVQSTTQQVIAATRRIVERAGDLSRASEAQYAQ